MKYCILVLAALTFATAQQYTTPVPILKQINKHNEDGSYSYGYEAADGTYKIESKFPNGEVYGKYGYKDDTGKLREIEYGATKRGFEPQGNDISVPPPTLNDDKNPARPLGPNEEDDGQYREDPSIYYKDERYNQNSVQQPIYRKNVGFQQTLQQPQYQQPSYQQAAYQQPQYQQPAAKFNFDDFINAPFRAQPQPQPKYQPQYQPKYQPQFQPQYQTQQAPSYYNPQPSYYNPVYNGPQHLQETPASNVNLDLGSYTINYR